MPSLIGSITQGRFHNAFCPAPGFCSQLGCRVEEFSFSPRHRGGFGSAGPGPARRVRGTVREYFAGTVWKFALLLKDSPHSRAIPLLHRDAPGRSAPGPAEPRAAGRERPGQPRTTAGAQRRRNRARPGAPAAASVRRFHLEGASRNCTRGAGAPPALARLSSARLGSAPDPWSRRGLQTPRSEQDGRFVRLLTLTRSFPSSHFRSL